MKFEDRRAKAKLAVLDFLSSFSPPRGLSDDALKTSVSNIADAFARRLPVTDAAKFDENIAKTFTSIRDHHKGYAWPVQSEFVDAMPKSATTTGGRVETYKTDQKQAIAQRMNDRQPVPETWIWGALSWPLVAGGQVSREVMDSYRRASVMNFKEVYSHDAYGILQARYGDVVGPYFDASETGSAA